MYIFGKGGVGFGFESLISCFFLGFSKVEVIDLYMSGLGFNEISGREGYGGSVYVIRDKVVQGVGFVGGSFVGGSNEIIGSINFREFFGKEGNRINVGS